AIWHLDSATNLNPKFVEAIDLKQQLTGKEVTDVDNSSVRGFLRREMMMERPLPTTMPYSTPIGDASDAIDGQDAEAMAQTELTLGPTTAPSSTSEEQPMIEQSPATQPAVADVPATQPAVADVPATAPSIAAKPSTQPSSITKSSNGDENATA